MKSRTLGKGLSALLADDDFQDGISDGISREKNTISFLNISDLVPGKYQPRKTFNDETIFELSQSIKEKGILYPILVRRAGDKYEIVAGERRWRAAKFAKLETVPVIIKDVNDNVALEISILENLQRESLTPLEEASAYKRLCDEFDYNHEQLSKVIGKSRSHITNIMRLLNLSPLVQKMVDCGSISVGHAKIIVGLPEENQEEVAKKAALEGMSVRSLERFVEDAAMLGQYVSEKHKKKKSKEHYNIREEYQLDDDLDYIQRSLSENLGMKVIVQDTGEGGRMIINFSSLEQLDMLIQKLSN